MKKIVFGIDISSKTLDICKKEAGKNEFYTIENEVSAIKKFFKKQIVQNAEILVGMENTGRYNWNLYEVLESFDFKIYVINPLHLKKSLGLVRGKNDKIDAERIAWFTEKNQEELLVWKPSSEVMKKIKVLFSERNSKVKLKAALLKQRQNYTQTKSLKLDKQLLKLNEKETKMLSEHIAFLENEIENLTKLPSPIRRGVDIVG